jgi:hypothetical protein
MDSLASDLEYRIQKRMYIKLPIYNVQQLFVYGAWTLILMLVNPLLRPLEGVIPENLDFFGP